MDPILQLKNITIKFNTLTANDNVCLDIKKGETHAILGENGAGKSTLMNILYGVLKPDSGQIILDGQQVNIRQPRDARALGVGMVHQHFMLIPALTVVENIILCTCRIYGIAYANIITADGKWKMTRVSGSGPPQFLSTYSSPYNRQQILAGLASREIGRASCRERV